MNVKARKNESRAKVMRMLSSSGSSEGSAQHQSKLPTGISRIACAANGTISWITGSRGDDVTVLPQSPGQ